MNVHGLSVHTRTPDAHEETHKVPLTQRAISKLNLSCWVDHKSQTGDKHWGQVIISSPSPTSISLRSSPTFLTLISICFPLSPPLAPSLLLLHPVLSSSYPISLSSIPASSRQFQISAKAAAHRLDAYCCYRNRPSALDYNVTLSARQGYNVCSFYSGQIHACLSIVCQHACQSVWLGGCSSASVFSCHWYVLHVILMSSVACSYTFKLQNPLSSEGRCL